MLLPLQGVGVYTLIPRALPWAVELLPFQGAPVRPMFLTASRPHIPCGPLPPILLSEPNPFHVWIEAIRPPVEEESREESANDINEIMCFDIYRGAAQQHV